MASGKPVSKRRMFTVVVLASLLFLSGLWLYDWSTGPASVRPLQASTNVQGAQTAVVPFQQFLGQRFATNVPGSLRKERHSNATAVVEQALFVGPSSFVEASSDQLAFTVGDLNGGSLEDLGDVRYRLRETSYQSVQLDWAPAQSFVFVKNTPSYEIGVFWQDGSRYAEVVASGSPARQSELLGFVRTAISKWQWL